MVFYKIEWKTSAKKELRKIERQEIPNPHPLNHKKFLGTQHNYRIRIGNYNDKI